MKFLKLTILILTFSSPVYARHFSLNKVQCELFNNGQKRVIHDVDFRVVCEDNAAKEIILDFEFERTWAEFTRGDKKHYTNRYNVDGAHAKRIVDFMGETMQKVKLYCAKGNWANTGATFKKRSLDDLVGYVDGIDANFDDCTQNKNQLIEKAVVGQAVNKSKREGEIFFDRVGLKNANITTSTSLAK